MHGSCFKKKKKSLEAFSQRWSLQCIHCLREICNWAWLKASFRVWQNPRCIFPLCLLQQNLYILSTKANKVWLKSMERTSREVWVNMSLEIAQVEEEEAASPQLCYSIKSCSWFLPVPRRRRAAPRPRPAWVLVPLSSCGLPGDNLCVPWSGSKAGCFKIHNHIRIGPLSVVFVLWGLHRQNPSLP